MIDATATAQTLKRRAVTPRDLVAEAGLCTTRAALADLVPMLRRFARLDALREELLRELGALAVNATHQGARLGNNRSWLLEEAGGALLCLFTPGPESSRTRYLHGCAAHRLWIAVSGRLRVDVYRHSEGAPEVFDPSHRLAWAESRIFAAGEAMLVSAWQDVVQVTPMDDSAAVLELSTKPVHTVRWVYDLKSLQPVDVISASPATQRLVHAVELLTELDAVEATDVLSALYEHPAHHVRWAALRAVAALDPDAAEPLLERARNDRHPHVARAARRALIEDHAGGA